MEFPIQKSQEEKYSVTFFQHIRVFEYIVSAAIFLCVLVVVVYCIWTLDRGFEITDEAYYLLLAQHAASVKYYISAQQWITGGIWQITQSLVIFRAAGMFLLVASSSLLAIGAMAAFSQSKLITTENIGARIIVLASTVISGLLYSTTINFSPCYNLLASAGAYVASGLVLFSFHCNIKWKKYGLLLLAASALGVEFINKASAGLATLGLVMISVFIFGRSLSDKLIAIIVIIVGFVLFILVLLHTQTTIQDAANSINQGLELFRMVQVESVEIRLERYFIEFLHFSFEAIRSFSMLILIIVIYLITRRPIFIGFALASLTYTFVFGKYLLGGADQYVLQMKFAFVLCALVVLISRPIWQKNNKTIFLIFGLILLPYSVAVGTGNSFFTQVIVSLAPWGTALALLAMSHFNNRADKTMLFILFTSFVLASTIQIVTSGSKPYHMLGQLSEQSTPTIVGSLGYVKVDVETKKFIDDLKDAAKTCSISRGEPFLGLYNIPGVSLVLETVPVLTPWLNNKTQAEFVIENNHNVSADRTVIALNILEDGKFPQLPKQLTMFPTGYRYCGMAIYPYMHQKIQIWQQHSK